MTLGFVHTDVRNHDEPIGDCVVRALALYTDTPYETVREHVEKINARGKRGHDTVAFGSFASEYTPLLEQHYGLVRLFKPQTTRMSYDEVHKRFGDCIIVIPQHMSCIIDGAVRDTFDHRDTPHVKDVWVTAKKARENGWRHY